MAFENLGKAFSSLSVPVTTVLLGSGAFVLGQIIRKGVIQPYREIQELRGKIASDIYFYNEYLANDVGEDEIRQEMKDTFRDHASELNSKMKMYAFIRPLTYLPTMPSLDELEEARKALTNLSGRVKVEKSSPFVKQEKVKEIKKNLRLD